MLLERARVVLDGEGKVKLLLTEVVGLSVIAQPCQLKAESGRAVAEEDDLIAAVRRVLFAHRLKAECVLIEFQAAVEVEDIEIEVVEFEHDKPSIMYLTTL